MIAVMLTQRCFNLCWISSELRPPSPSHRQKFLSVLPNKATVRKTKVKPVLQSTNLQTWYKKSLRPHEGLRVIRHYPPDFWEKLPISLSPKLALPLWSSRSLKTDPVLPEGSARCKPKKEFFTALCGRHVVKGFGSDCLTAVGAVCVRASFIAVEIWCGESMHMGLYIAPLLRLKCIQSTSSYWEPYYAAQGNTSSLWLHRGPLSGLCLSGFILSFYYTVQWVTGNAPCLSQEDHQDWTARVLSSANTADSSCPPTPPPPF